ncbi:MAG: type II secretion system F family protein [Candidatus Paceibacterota bacterium]
MIFKYKAIDNSGQPKEGTIEAVSLEVAISSLQKRDLVLSNITPVDDKSFLERNISFFDKVSNKDIVILSRQMATLFEAQVSALRVFELLSTQSERPSLRRKLGEVASDLQAGNTISEALAKHPDVFSEFYVNMVKSGEESGKLDQTLLYLADYLDRTHEVTSKVKSALIYPAFIVFTFVAVMVLMLTVVIPKISAILTDSGQAIPIYTQIVLGISGFFVNYGVLILIILVVGGFFFWRYSRTEAGQYSIDRFKISMPAFQILYRKLYLSRIADNMNVMLLSGIPIVRGLELTAKIVDNKVFEKVLTQATEDVKTGNSISDAMMKSGEIPGIFIQMVKIGEETGQLGNILKTLAAFYRREVINAIDALVGLIEPVMIVFLGFGVAFLLASVLIPIYNISGAM